MSWFKRTLKKIGNTASDMATGAVNSATSPIRAGIDLFNGKSKGMPVIGNYRNTKFGNTLNDIHNVVGKVGLGAAAVGGGIAAAPAISGFLGGSGLLAGLLGKAKGGVRNLLDSGNGAGGVKNLLTGNGSYFDATENSIVPKADSSTIGDWIRRLPSLGDVFNGAVSGAGGALSDSQAGQEVKNQAAKSWLQENGQKIIIGLLAAVVAVLSFFAFRSKPKYKRR